MPDRGSPVMPNDSLTKRVIISGAGPAGLLLTSLLLARNKGNSQVQYDVTLVDARDDYGSFTKEEL